MSSKLSLLDRLDNLPEGGHDDMILALQHKLPHVRKNENFRGTIERDLLLNAFSNAIKQEFDLSSNPSKRNIYEFLSKLLKLNISMSSKQIEPDAVTMSMIYSRIYHYGSI